MTENAKTCIGWFFFSLNGFKEFCVLDEKVNFLDSKLFFFMQSMHLWCNGFELYALSFFWIYLTGSLIARWQEGDDRFFHLFAIFAKQSTARGLWPF